MCENSSVFYFSMISFQTGFSARKKINVKIQGEALKSSQNLAIATGLEFDFGKNTYGPNSSNGSTELDIGPPKNAISPK